MGLSATLGRLRRRWPALLAPSKAPEGWSTDGPRVIITLAADYPNLGDVALTRATLAFCREHLPGHRPHVIPAHQTLRVLRGASRHAASDDVVVITGGGNLGDRYRRLEELRCEVVRAFPRQRIVSFPQSCEWSATARGREALAYSRHVYAAHPRLTLLARDRDSLARMRAAFPDTRVGLAPDTALWLRPDATQADSPPLVCLRRDDESALDGAEQRRLATELAAAWPGATQVDTAAEGTVDLDGQLDRLLPRFAEAQLVVTDRLHGLVFARLHGRPCVGIEGANGKLRALVETWFPDAGDIRVLRRPNPTEVLASANEVLSAPPYPHLDRIVFEPLARTLRGGV